MERSTARIRDVYEVKKDFKIDGGNVPADIYIIVDGVEVCRGTASALLLACSEVGNRKKVAFRKCHNGYIQLPYETLNHLIQSGILELFDTNVPATDIDAQ